MMRSRSLLHRSKVELFKLWLAHNGHKIIKAKGDYEVLRWKGVKGEPMPIVFDRHEGDHLTTNKSATKYVRRWLNHTKESE